MSIAKKDLVAAAKALNMILGLTPAIDTKAGVEELKIKLTEAGELLVPEDVIPEKVKAVLEELGVVIADPENQEWEDEEEGELPAEDNAEEADPEAEEDPEEDEEEEEIKPAKKVKKEKEKPAKKEPKKEKEKPAKKEPKKAKDPEPAKKLVTKITKKSIVEQFIDSKKGGTVEQMAEAIVKAGIDPDYEKNLRVVKLWLRKMGFKVTKAAMEQNPIFKR